MTDDINKYENIAVLSPTKQRFIKQYNAAKKGKRHFYMDDFLNELLELHDYTIKAYEQK